MRGITKIIVHCSATKPSMDIGAEEIKRWHSDPKPKGNGWSDIGYHYVTRRNGKIEKGRDIGIAGAHAYGHNFSSIGVCIVGGIDEDGNPEDNFATIQLSKTRKLLDFLVLTFPDAEVVGHRDLPGVTKNCPCYDVREWYYGN